MDSDAYLLKGVLTSAGGILAGGVTLMDKIAEWNTVLAFIGGAVSVFSACLGGYYIILGIRLRRRELEFSKKNKWL